MHLTEADRMVNSVDPDQTAPEEAVSSGSTQFAQTWILTHISLVDMSILTNWKSLFPILGVSGVLLHFYSISNRYLC